MLIEVHVLPPLEDAHLLPTAEWLNTEDIHRVQPWLLDRVGTDSSVGSWVTLRGGRPGIRTTESPETLAAMAGPAAIDAEHPVVQPTLFGNPWSLFPIMLAANVATAVVVILAVLVAYLIQYWP